MSKTQTFIDRVATELPHTPALAAYVAAVREWIRLGHAYDAYSLEAAFEAWQAQGNVCDDCWQALSDEERAACDKIAGIKRQ